MYSSLYSSLNLHCHNLIHSSMLQIFFFISLAVTTDNLTSDVATPKSHDTCASLTTTSGNRLLSESKSTYTSSPMKQTPLGKIFGTVVKI